MNEDDGSSKPSDRKERSGDVEIPHPNAGVFSDCRCASCFYAERELRHIARQAYYDVLGRVLSKLIVGRDGLRPQKYHKVPILVSSVREFDAAFLAAAPLRVAYEIKKPKPVSTYEGLTPVTKACVSYVFCTLVQWIEFVGTAGTWVCRHKYLPRLICIACPHASLAPGVCFDEHHAQWEPLMRQGYPLLKLTHSIPNAENVLQSAVGRNAAEMARNYRVWILNQSMDAFYVFVREGEVNGAPIQSYTLCTLPALEAETEETVVRLRGHFGWVSKDALTWQTKTAGLITATFSDIRTKQGLPLRTLTSPSLMFCPLVVVQESGNVAL